MPLSRILEIKLSGNVSGGRKAAQKNKELYGEDYYKNIGSKGGRTTGPKGFSLNKELAREAGSRGGRASRRGVTKKLEYKGEALSARTIAEREGVSVGAIHARVARQGRATLDE
jgi:general stress protein YciG